MGDFSLVGGAAQSIEEGFDYSNTRGTAVTSGVANTVGSYVELLSAVNNTVKAESYIVTIFTAASADASILVNIAIGGAGSEQDVAPNLLVWQSLQSNKDHPFYFSFPVTIPSGQRISANCQSSSATQTCYVNLSRAPGSFRSGSGLSVITDIGTTLASSRGTTVARSTANTFGAWVEMTASLADSIKGFVISSIRAATIGSWSNAQLTYDVGVGGAGNEEIIYSGPLIAQFSTEVAVNAISPFIGVGVASGQRIAIRAQSDVANADLDFDYIIYGVR